MTRLDLANAAVDSAWRDFQAVPGPLAYRKYQAAQDEAESELERARR